MRHKKLIKIKKIYTLNFIIKIYNLKIKRKKKVLTFILIFMINNINSN